MNTTLPTPSAHRRAIIYVAIEFTAQPDGSQVFRTHYVAATSCQEAMALLRDDGVDGEHVYISNNDAHSLGSPVRTIDNQFQSREFTVTAEKHWHWLNHALSTYENDGEIDPPSWLLVPCKVPSVALAA